MSASPREVRLTDHRHTRRIPSYRRHKPSGQAVVTLDGRDYYLGPYGSRASKAEYDRLIAQWLAAGRRLAGDADGMTVSELILAYLRFARGYYRKDGRLTSQYSLITHAVRPLKQLYGRIAAGEFGPVALKAVRQQMIDAGISRGVINQYVGCIKRMFKWAVSNELLPADVYQALATVTGLRAGRSAARETEPVGPVPEAHIEAIRSYVSAQVWAMVQLQRLTGMRPGEVVAMRGRDIDTTGKVWLYRPPTHKTAHHGIERVIDLGPRAQQLIKPFLRSDVDAYLFSPAESEQARNAMRRANRKTPITPSQLRRLRISRRRKRRRAPGVRYETASYRRAIARACARAGIPRWHPHQLRHNFATQIRKQFGLETARVLLGHRSMPTTEIYAEIDRQKARQVIAQVG